jgi:hypothetical protein
MNCQEYLALFSDHQDGRADAEVSARLEAHRSACPACDRYSRTLEAGLQLLKTLPPLEVPSDFRPRLDHRIYHIEDGQSIAREALGTGATTVSVLAIAILLAFAAWTPTVRVTTPAVELPTLVVQGPTASTFTRRDRSSTFTRGLSLYPSREFPDGFWGDPHQLLFEFSTLSERRRAATFAGIAVE